MKISQSVPGQFQLKLTRSCWYDVMLIMVIICFFSLMQINSAHAQRANKSGLVGIVGADDRVMFSSQNYPWLDAVGRLNTPGAGFCTAVLIAPSAVLTAAHCLFNKRQVKISSPDSIHFVAGYRKGNYRGHARGKRFIFDPGLRFDEKGNPSQTRDDWAIVLLEKDLKASASIEPIGLSNIHSTSVYATDQSVVRVGYSKDRPHLPTMVKKCFIRGIADQGRLFYHDCDATWGDSGSPLLVYDGGRPFVLGVHSAVAQTVSKTRGVAVNIDQRIPTEFNDQP